MEEFRKEIEEVDNEAVAAALEYGTTAMTVFQDVEDLMNQHAQETISYSIESPLDYGKSEVKQFPLSFDSLEFDVQYVRGEGNEQTSASESGTKNESSKKERKINIGPQWWRSTGGGMGTSTETNKSVNDSITKQYQNHNIEGTIVISAKTTHKNADIISPFRLDPLKAVTAWNYTYPDDVIDVKPASLLEI
eukprot:CAMPEP_0194174892 /NCGR_PEP_ID=MMETSP0154-20130528/9027_1 /TAXON_ID=1049557 /ORGANISM="Thalassiothrix antarctica, Strain L6-D1" /LENGTH=191 /DNA_ID=CAMNT_0038888499 /DNA_START=131 /DNA_END=703 /DNA_ORIENTATION=+